jgi:hypothetical protein
MPSASCNARPPQGHPWFGTQVTCHLLAGHGGSKIPHSWEIDTTPMPWCARFLGGPLAGSPERVFAVGPVWSEIKLAPMPPEVKVDWAIVGGTGIPDDDEAGPWPGEERYVLAEVVDAFHEQIEAYALYRWSPRQYMPPDRRDDARRYWGD